MRKKITKKRVLIILLPLLPFIVFFAYLFIRYSSAERSIYFSTLKYRLNYKLECAREATPGEQEQNGIDRYIRFREAVHADTEPASLKDICHRCTEILSEEYPGHSKAQICFMSGGQGEFLFFFTDESGRIYKVISQISGNETSRFYFTRSELEEAFPGSEIVIISN